MNPGFTSLQPYPFARLSHLIEKESPNPDLDLIKLTIGEPKHNPPKLAQDLISSHFDTLRRYPPTGGTAELKDAIGTWLASRFRLQGMDAGKMVLPVNGTREALFAVAQCFCGPDSSGTDSSSAPLVLMPNPFYQIYEGAALLAGAQPLFYTLDDKGVPQLEHISEEQWQRTQLMYLCTPGNPGGLHIPKDTLMALIRKARQHHIVLVSDECYSELYLQDDAPCTGLLEACEALSDTGEIGNTREPNYQQCLVFHSLSKRSNLPGLRSGFCAGDPDLIARFLQYRTYHGSAMPLHHQAASATAWLDEEHVIENRQRYRQKYDAAMPLLQKHGHDLPQSGFYLWFDTPIDDRQFAVALYRTQSVLTLPGSFLGREIDGVNPGQNKIRMALVDPLDTCLQALERLDQFMTSGL